MDDTKRTMLEWVSIDRVLPNPFNPRRDLAEDIEDMKRIIMSRGWEEGLTTYRRGNFFIILSGHRRWTAARELGIKEVPVYIVDAPLNDQEAIERMASLQRAHVDWSVYEWARFTYDAWIYWNKIPYKDLAVMINKGTEIVKEYIGVFEFYPKEEIENKLESGTFSMSVLFKLRSWLNRLEAKQATLVQSLTKDLIRKIMLRKLENKRINSHTLSGDKFIEVATEAQMKEFLIKPDMSLLQAQSLIGVDKEKRVGHWQGQMMRMSFVARDIPALAPKNKDQAKALDKQLDMLILEAKRKKKALRERKWDTEPQLQAN